MPSPLLMFRQSLARFLNNASYATWVQSVVVLLSVFIAVVALQHTDANQTVQSSLSFGQRFFLDNPSPANASLTLRTNQFKLVQDAKQKLENYDPASDKGFTALFRAAAPMIKQSIGNDPKLQDLVHQVDNFFSPLFVCIDQHVCDRQTALNMLSFEILTFFNAVCPYMEEEDRTFHNRENMDRYMSFLVDIAGYRDPDTHVCKESLGAFLAAARKKETK
jgi:hypothetical protein